MLQLLAENTDTLDTMSVKELQGLGMFLAIDSTLFDSATSTEEMISVIRNAVTGGNEECNEEAKVIRETVRERLSTMDRYYLRIGVLLYVPCTPWRQ